MRVIRCDRCGKDILAPKHVFTVEGKDRDTPGNYRSPGSKTFDGEYCVDCHSVVKDAAKPVFKVKEVDE